MNGAADLGGMMGFGPVEPGTDERFHAGWERRVLACTLAVGAIGRWSLDETRFVRESLPPPVYLTSSYYEIWLRALETLLVTHGLVGADELAAGRPLRPGEPVPVLTADRVAPVLAAGAPCVRPVDAPPRFAVGDPVRARNDHPAGHTRLPRYVRGRDGVVTAVHGGHVLPDRNAHRAGEDPRWLYTVRFAAAELWGAAADPTSAVTVEAWEPYLEPRELPAAPGRRTG